MISFLDLDDVLAVLCPLVMALSHAILSSAHNLCKAVNKSPLTHFEDGYDGPIGGVPNLPSLHPKPPPLTMFLTATSPWFLAAHRERESTSFLGSLCRCITILVEKKFFLVSNLNTPQIQYDITMKDWLWDKGTCVQIKEQENVG